VNRAVTSPLLHESLAAVLRGERVAWSTLGLAPDAVLDACIAHDLTSLFHQRLTTQHAECGDWPLELREAVARYARAEAARELLRWKEIVSVLDALTAAGVHPILLKGTPLAYSVYEAPSTRPRDDTDLLVPREQVEAVRQTMAGLGYVPTLYCEGELVFCQFEMRRTDGFGVDHAFDFHWKISTQSLFADLLSYDELAADARAVPALGPHARTAGPRHALLLACVHPAMHHRNAPRVLWLYDIHLLASPFSAAEFEGFVDLALTKRVTAIVAHQLALARSLWGTSIPDSVIGRLHASETPEPSATYLLPDRAWRHELVSNVRGLPTWYGRVRLLREVLFPSPAYMRRSYGVAVGMRGGALLPALYLHRIVHGAGKVLRGRK
jgi:hypothetical protein